MDGETYAPTASIPDAAWISKGYGPSGGAARARTLGLTRVAGKLTRCLDADDLFPDEETLHRDIETLTADPTLGWCVAPCLDMWPDGSLVPGPRDPAPGRLSSGALLEGLLGHRFPVMGTTMTAHTDLIRALGAWPALPGAEDAALLVAASIVADGWMQGTPGELYRKHATQNTSSATHHDTRLRDMRVSSIIDHAHALVRTGWRWPPQHVLSVDRATTSRPAEQHDGDRTSTAVDRRAQAGWIREATRPPRVPRDDS
ncbi:GltA [Embleya sp. NPDC001921]